MFCKIVTAWENVMLWLFYRLADFLCVSIEPVGVRQLAGALSLVEQQGISRPNIHTSMHRAGQSDANGQ